MLTLIDTVNLKVFVRVYGYVPKHTPTKAVVNVAILYLRSSLPSQENSSKYFCS